MSRTITLVGARGGQGTSTVAAVLAARLSADAPTTLLSHEPLAVAHLLAAPLPLPGEAVEVTPGLQLAGLDGPRSEVTVIDAGRATTAPTLEGECLAVVRGPCYLALATLVSLSLRLDGVVLLAEPGRALWAEDVTAVLDVPVVASVPIHPAVARTIDAGLLAEKGQGLAAFRSLEVLAGRSHRAEVRTERTPDLVPSVDPAGLVVNRRSPGRAVGLAWEVDQ
jgi:hypothetical protein